ncbi:hypothetical protein Landi51_12592 [Colletotrichum acutatum]
MVRPFPTNPSTIWSQEEGFAYTASPEDISAHQTRLNKSQSSKAHKGCLLVPPRFGAQVQRQTLSTSTSQPGAQAFWATLRNPDVLHHCFTSSPLNAIASSPLSLALILTHTDTFSLCHPLRLSLTLAAGPSSLESGFVPARTHAAAPQAPSAHILLARCDGGLRESPVFSPHLSPPSQGSHGFRIVELEHLAPLEGKGSERQARQRIPNQPSESPSPNQQHARQETFAPSEPLTAYHPVARRLEVQRASHSLVSVPVFWMARLFHKSVTVVALALALFGRPSISRVTLDQSWTWAPFSGLANSPDLIWPARGPFPSLSLATCDWVPTSPSVCFVWSAFFVQERQSITIHPVFSLTLFTPPSHPYDRHPSLLLTLLAPTHPYSPTPHTTGPTSTLLWIRWFEKRINIWHRCGSTPALISSTTSAS